MPKRRRQVKIPTPDWDPHHRGAIGARLFGRSPQFYGTALIGLLVVLALGVIGYAFAADYIEEQQRPGSTALQVEDTRFRLDYFSDRYKMYLDQFGAQNPQVAQPEVAVPAVSELLIKEEIVRRYAAELEVTVTDEEIRTAIASRLALQPDSETFQVAYDQELARTGLSDAEYRQMVEATELERKLRDHFLTEVPASADSVRYRQMLLSTDELAQELRQEVQDGGDFAALAKENSLDAATKDKGGEVGWVPRGSLDASVEELIFGMDVGAVSTIPVPSGVLLLEMEEKAEDRKIDEGQKPTLASAAFDKWLEEKKEGVEIVNSMDGGDLGKIEWAVRRAQG